MVPNKGKEIQSCSEVTISAAIFRQVGRTQILKLGGPRKRASKLNVCPNGGKSRDNVLK